MKESVTHLQLFIAIVVTGQFVNHTLSVWEMTVQYWTTIYLSRNDSLHFP